MIPGQSPKKSNDEVFRDIKFNMLIFGGFIVAVRAAPYLLSFVGSSSTSSSTQNAASSSA